MKMPLLLIRPKIVLKNLLIKKGGCFQYHAVMADKIEYGCIHREFICPALGMDRRSFFMPKTTGKYKRLEVFYLSKPVYAVYAADKPSDCHYCYFWTNDRSTTMEIPFLFICPLPVQAEGYDFPQNPSEKRAFPAERGGEDA